MAWTNWNEKAFKLWQEIIAIWFYFKTVIHINFALIFQINIYNLDFSFFMNVQYIF